MRDRKTFAMVKTLRTVHYDKLDIALRFFKFYHRVANALQRAEDEGFISGLPHVELTAKGKNFLHKHSNDKNIK